MFSPHSPWAEPVTLESGVVRSDIYFKKDDVTFILLIGIFPTSMVRPNENKSGKN
jgi:hypothetical protein